MDKISIERFNNVAMAVISILMITIIASLV